MNKNFSRLYAIFLMILSIDMFAAEDKEGKGFSTENPYLSASVPRRVAPAPVRDGFLSQISRRLSRGMSSRNRALEKETLIVDEHLKSPQALMRFLKKTGETYVDRDMHEDTKRAIFILLERDVFGGKSRGRHILENIYAIAGTASGAAATYNIVTRNFYVPVGWVLGGYDKYGESASFEDKLVLGVLNGHAFLALYPFIWGQMIEDAHDISSQARYARRYPWQEGNPDESWPETIRRNLTNSILYLPHSISEMMGTTSMPHTPHWSEPYVMTAAWLYWVGNTIPEMSALIPVLIETGNWWTGSGVFFALLQRIGEQRRRSLPAIEKYYAKTAEWGATDVVNRHRAELVDALEGTIRRIRGDLRTEEKKVNVLALADLVHRRSVLETEARKGSTGPSLVSASAAAVPSSKDTVSISPVDEDEALTDEGILQVLYGYGGLEEGDEKDVHYQESWARKGVGALAGTVGLWGAATAGIIIDVAVKSGLVFVGVSPEAADIFSKFVSVSVGSIGAGSSSSANREYALRVYDAFTEDYHHRRLGELNPYFTDVVYGAAEGPVLIVNYLEGVWWDGTLYAALGVPALAAIGVPFSESASLLLPTLFARGSIAAAEQADDIQTAGNALQRLRRTQQCTSGCDRILDTIFCCFRGRIRCTRRNYLQGTDQKRLEELVEAHRLLKAVAAERKSVHMAPTHVIEDKSRLFIERNPFLRASSGSESPSSGAALSSLSGVTAIIASVPDVESAASVGGGIPIKTFQSRSRIKELLEEAEDKIIAPPSGLWGFICSCFGKKRS